MKSLYCKLTLLIVICAPYIGLSQPSSYSDIKFNPIGFYFIIQLANGKIISTENLIINYEHIASIEDISKITALNKYGLMLKSGAELFKIKPGITLIGVATLFEKFSIHEDYRVPVYVDDELVGFPETLIVDESEIKSVDQAGQFKSRLEPGRINIFTFHPGPPKTEYSRNSYTPYWIRIEANYLDSLLNTR